VSTEAPVTKTSNKTKNANGRGSTYIVTKANGKKVRKAAINDVNGKRRVKTFKSLSNEINNPPIKVSDSRAVEDSLSSSTPEQALFAWYQVRSNLQHRGKASLFDASLVHKSCIGLSNFLLEYLRINVQGIENEWEKLLEEKLTKSEFVETF
jgi:hypothetical protein